MSFAARRAYACPICSEGFLKWSICQSHVNTVETCRAALGDHLRQQEELQEFCRLAANGEFPLLEQVAQAAAFEDAPAEVVVQEPKPKGPAPLTLGALVPAPVPMPVGLVRPMSESSGFLWPESPEKLNFDLLNKKANVDDWMPLGLDGLAKLQVNHASMSGFLPKEEQSSLVKTLKTLADYAPEEQRHVIQKFLSPSFDDFQCIAMKFLWLQRCMDFCRDTAHSSERSAPLLQALEAHGLREEAISENCWNTFQMFPEPLQTSVAQAVRSSLVMKTTKEPSRHFTHLCVNEEAIYNLEAQPQEAKRMEQGSLESFSDSQYSTILRQMLVNHRGAEETIFTLLAEETTGPGLLEVHLATQDARHEGSAEVISLLHAAAACGLSRLCARVIAEGLDVNERTGHQHFSPLHLAAVNGSLETTQLLLQRGAQAWLLDDSGKTPLYHVVTALPEATRATHDNMLKICQQLVCGMLQASEEDQPLVDSALEILQQSELTWLLQLHDRMRELQMRNEQVFNAQMLVELGSWQYETVNLLLSLFDSEKVKSTVPAEALHLEFAAVAQSEFMQEQEQVRKRVNILAQVLHLSKPLISLMAAMPLQGIDFAIQTFSFEERSPGVYVPAEPEKDDSEPEGERTRNLREDATRRCGTVANWDPKRGFGFIRDQEDGEGVEIFVHRSNLMGSGFDLEILRGSRVSFIPSIQEGRPRALDCAMIDADFNVDPRHLGQKTEHLPKEKKIARLKEAMEKEEHALSKSFLQHLASPAVQEVLQEKRQEGDTFLRCLGLVRQMPGRRDDVVSKKEIERRIDILLSLETTPLTKKDLDFRCRRFLTEFCMRQNVVRVSEALAMVEKSTSGKRREEVRSWPAYVATLLRRFDPDMTINLERKPKAEAKKKDGKDLEFPEKIVEESETSSGEPEVFDMPPPGAEFAFQ